jgi:hypothetical protein
VKNTRKIGKRDMKNNDNFPESTSIPRRTKFLLRRIARLRAGVGAAHGAAVFSVLSRSGKPLIRRIFLHSAASRAGETH